MKSWNRHIQGKYVLQILLNITGFLYPLQAYANTQNEIKQITFDTSLLAPDGLLQNNHYPNF